MFVLLQDDDSHLYGMRSYLWYLIKVKSLLCLLKQEQGWTIKNRELLRG